MRKRDDELSKGWGQIVTPEIETNGGKIALEQKTGKKVVSKDNYLQKPQNKKLLE